MFRIKIKMKKQSKGSIILLTVVLLGLLLSNFIDNIYVDAGAVLLALAAICAEVTEDILRYRKRKRDEGRQ